MKIALKIKYHQLVVILTVINQDREIVEHNTIEEKIKNYILLDVLKKLVNTQINKIGVKKEKQFSISLKYQEAAILWSVLGNLNTTDVYKKNVILLISEQLHQKLIN